MGSLMEKPDSDSHYTSQGCPNKKVISSDTYRGELWCQYPNVAKAGGLQSQGVKGEAVVVYRESLTTPDLMSSGFPEG